MLTDSFSLTFTYAQAQQFQKNIDHSHIIELNDLKYHILWKFNKTDFWQLNPCNPRLITRPIRMAFSKRQYLFFFRAANLRNSVPIKFRSIQNSWDGTMQPWLLQTNLSIDVNTQTTETEEEEPSCKWQDASVFTLHGNLRPKSLKHKSVQIQVTKESWGCYTNIWYGSLRQRIPDHMYHNTPITGTGISFFLKWKTLQFCCPTRAISKITQIYLKSYYFRWEAVKPKLIKHLL